VKPRSDIKPTQEKRCLICGKRLQRKRWSTGVLEDVTAYNKRQFCSLSCANSRSKGGLSRKAFCAQARKKRKDYCEACGSRNRLQVHHVNEDWMDNADENLQTLCIFCHQFWHATHRRLGLKCSERMPQLATLSLLAVLNES
jgi:hypothetical protein